MCSRILSKAGHRPPQLPPLPFLLWKSLTNKFTAYSRCENKYIQSKSDISVLSGYFAVFVMQKLGQNNPISTVCNL